MLTYVAFTFINTDIPLDLYKTINTKRIIGNGRNIAGFFFFTFVALLIGIIQHRPLQAFYLGIGGIIGTYINSFIKRRLNFKRGQYIFFLDQTDFILFSSLMYITAYPLTLNIFLSGITIGFLLHHLINLLRTSWEKLIKRDKSNIYKENIQ